MKILFYLGHPAHYHNISIVLPNLLDAGHKVILYARGKDVLFDLITSLNVKIYRSKIVNRFPNKINIIIGTLKREFELTKILFIEKPDILLGTDLVITHIGRLFKTPAIVLNEDDAKAVPLLAKYGFKYSTYTLSPDCCDLFPYNTKKIDYPSYHELGYLHPNHFSPNKQVVEKYLKLDKNYFIIRFSNLQAHHDSGIRGITDTEAIELVNLLSSYGRILITSERKLNAELDKYRLFIEPKDMHHLLAFASLYIGDSQTMAAEAGVLGTPFIRYNDFVDKLGYLEELEKKYKLGVGIKPPNFKKLLDVATKFLDNRNTKKDNIIKRNKMISEKIDFSKFLLWFIVNYPQSTSDLKQKKIKLEQFR